MKTGFALLVLLATSFQALSQAQENDDMYFSSKDRAKQDLVVRNNRASKETKSDADERFESTAINPTDSYSARNVNPEYNSRSQSEAEENEDTGYFSNSYTPSSVNKNLYNNYSSNNGFYSPYYGNGFDPYNYYGGYGMNSMYGMSPYGMGMGFRPGLSIGLGYGMGMGSMYGSYGMGMGYYGMGGMYNPYMMGMYDPYWGGSMMYSGMYGMYNPWAYNGFYSPYYGYGYPGSIIIGGGDLGGRNLSYQRRNDRSRITNNAADNTTRNVSSVTRNGRPIGTSSTGRVSSESAQSQNYYQRGWRNNGSTTTTRSQWNNSGSNNAGSNSGRTRSWGNAFDNSGNNNSFQHNNGSFGGNNGGNSGSNWGGGSNSRSSWSNGNSSFGGGGSIGGGGGRSSGGSGGGGGSTRGRH